MKLHGCEENEDFGYLEEISSGVNSMHAKGPVVISVTGGSAFARKCSGKKKPKNQTAEFHQIHRSSSMEMSEQANG